MPSVAPLSASVRAPRAAVRVDAPARLHLGFLDPSGTLGRAFGSVGVTISGCSTQIEMEIGDVDRFVADDDVAKQEIPRAERAIALLRASTGIERPLHVALRRTLPPHAGFGSGTQLALAVGCAFAAVNDLSLSHLDVAQRLSRGMRSGIGVGAFAYGGFLVDAGHSTSSSADSAFVSGSTLASLPPIVVRLDFPDAWRIVLVLDERLHGLHGGQEGAAIAALPPFPAPAAAQLCHQLVMRVLPGVAERDFARFSEGVATLQEANGRYFAAAQGGGMFVSESVARVLLGARERFGAAVGQSSWGPTGFAFVPDASVAEEVLRWAVSSGTVDRHVRLLTVSGRNRGASVTSGGIR